MNAWKNFVSAIRNAGITGSDSDEIRLQKTLLVLATGLVSAGSALWLWLYWLIGPNFSATAPLLVQLILTANLAWFLKTGDFERFRITQISLFLFVPFLAQWSIGTFISSSGISLWGLLAPIGAVLIIGSRASLAWFVAYLFLLVLSGVFDFLLADAGQYASAHAISGQTTAIFFGLNFIGVSSVAYWLIRFSASERQKTMAALEETHQLLQAEQERSERLLLNILPEPIADRLKNSEQTIADGFADVTVMFADIVNFTKVAEGMTPQGVFSMLNRVFSSFDDLAERHGLEKIKTIGDAYMVAGGLHQDEKRYAEHIANMALDMMDMLHHDFNINRQHLEMRIGIGSGPVVAGVVGKKKFIYDLWGDTVNIASRLTSEGSPGKIVVDERSYRHLVSGFDFSPPRVLSLKGKGDMIIYELLGRRLDSRAGGKLA